MIKPQVSRLVRPYLYDMPQTRGRKTAFIYSIKENYLKHVALQIWAALIASYNTHPGSTVFCAISKLRIITGPWRIGDQYFSVTPITFRKVVPNPLPTDHNFFTFFCPEFPTQDKPQYILRDTPELKIAIPYHYGVPWDYICQRFGIDPCVWNKIRTYDFSDDLVLEIKKVLLFANANPEWKYSEDFLPKLPVILDVPKFEENRDSLSYFQPSGLIEPNGFEIIDMSIEDMEERYGAQDDSYCPEADAAFEANAE